MRALRTAGALALLLAGCQEDLPPRLGDGTAPAPQDHRDAMLVLPDPEPPDPDSSTLCGSLVVPIVLTRPNFYFVLDASGSMDAPIPGVAVNGIQLTRYRAAYLAIAEVLRAVGHRIRYGAAVFPGSADSSGPSCPPGKEILETGPGDPVSFALSGKDGPVLDRLLRLIVRHSPGGLTPTASTLRVLSDRVLGLEGETFVFLITDGAPNCNGDTPCTASSCTANVEGLCPPELNCCDPAVTNLDWRWCLDADPTISAVRTLANHDIKTFVIGMPGTEEYGGLLDELALAGRTARDRSPFYYPVDTADQLTSTLKRIGADAAIKCTMTLEEAPPDRSLVNVYFDQVLVEQDPEDGWIWSGDDTIEMVGQSCRLLKAGDVLQVQVAAGCPTVVR